MVVLAASIITKTGKALVSRQFVDMTRIRIEGLLAAFPKLIGSGKQHTFVETENVRYVYQPMDALYLLLVTNKQSNILEDLETLRLLSKLVPEYCQALDDEGVQRCAFELIFAFDEVISLGHKENVTLQQVKTCTEMESHEEKLHKMIIQSKINDTKDVMKRKAMEIEKTKSKEKPSFPSLGFGSRNTPAPEVQETKPAAPAIKATPFVPAAFSSAAPTTAPPGKGMQLGKSTKTNAFLESLRAEGEIMESEASSAAATAAAARGGGAVVTAVSTVPAGVASKPVVVSVDEKLVAVLKKDGGVDNLEVQGTMTLEVKSEDSALIRVVVDHGEDAGFQFKTHPNIDKALYSGQSMLGLKDPSRPFPTGSALGVLKWRMQTKDEALVPLSINCWPSLSGSETYVNIEYESTSSLDLQNVVITIPLPGNTPPVVKQIDGEFRFDARRAVLEWTIDLIDDTNRTGAMEFVVPAADNDAFFPIDVHFSSNKTFCSAKVQDVVHASSGEPVKWGGHTILTVDSYQVV
eukprot:jgi/Mesvir1/16256/Mv08504-RA.1